MSSSRIFLVRHGQTAWNDKGRYQGHSDIPLDTGGIQQALLTAERLEDEKISVVYSSDLSRAADTAKTIADVSGVELITTPKLRESGFGEWEGKSREQIEKEHPGEFQAYMANSLTNRPPGGESLQEVKSRVITVLMEVKAKQEGETAVIVGHGGCLRWIVLNALSAPDETYRHLRLDNGSVSIVEWEGERGWLSLFNDTSHLRSLLSNNSTSIGLNQ